MGTRQRNISDKRQIKEYYYVEDEGSYYQTIVLTRTQYYDARLDGILYGRPICAIEVPVLNAPTYVMFLDFVLRDLRRVSTLRYRYMEYFRRIPIQYLPPKWKLWHEQRVR